MAVLLPELEGRGDAFPGPLAAAPDLLRLVVAGGDSRHTSWFPAWPFTDRATDVIA